MHLRLGPPTVPPGSLLFGSLPRAAASSTTAAVRGGPGGRRPPWRGQRGPCPGRWACAGRPASAGRSSGRPGGTGSPCRSWRLWTGSPSGPWAGWGETLHWLQGGRKIHRSVRDSWRLVFIREGRPPGSHQIPVHHPRRQTADRTGLSSPSHPLWAVWHPNTCITDFNHSKNHFDNEVKKSGAQIIKLMFSLKLV